MSQTSSESAETKEASQNPTVEVAKSNLPAENAKTSKVELDIEDAPFLKEKEEQPAAATAGSEEGAEAEKPEDKGKKKKKLLIIGAAALLVVVVGASAAWFLLKPGADDAPPPPVVEEIKPEVIVVPSKQTPTIVPDIVKTLDQFIVPTGDTLTKTNFLVCRFSIITKNPGLETEIDNKMIPLRDAVYFYLRSKSYDFLLSPANGQEIKNDLVGILNDFLTTGKVEDVLLDTYLGH